MTAPQKIVIVGAGIIGVTMAYELAWRGCEVTLIERHDGTGMETSFANGGQLGTSEVAPWAGPEVPGLVLRWLMRVDAPFRLRLKPDPEQWLWLLKFLLRCRNSARMERIAPNLALALLSRARMDELAQSFEAQGTPLAYDEARCGILSVFRDHRDMREAKPRAQAMRRLGLELHELDGAATVRIEPALEAAHAAGAILGGLYAPHDRSGDAYAFTIGLAARLPQMGVRIVTRMEVMALVTNGTRVTGISTRNSFFPSDAVVLASGVTTTRLARALGIRLAIYPVKGYSVTLPAPHEDALHVSITDESRRIVVSRLGERIRAAGTAEIAGYDLSLEPARARGVLTSLLALFPDLATEVADLVFWCGLRPMTPDGSPLIGRAGRFENLYVNSGHGTLGWTLAMGSAVTLADLLSGVAPRLDLQAFAPGRL